MAKIQTSDWRNPAVAPIILIFGSEDFLANRAINTIKAKLREQDSNLEIHEIDASDYSSGQLLSLSSPSLFAEPRYIEVSGAEKCSDAFIEDVITYSAETTPDTVVVIRHSGSSVRGKKFLEALRANSALVEITCLEIKKEPERQAFVQNEFKSAGRQVSQGAVRAITEAFAEDLAELAAACQQLLMDSSETIDEQLVEKYYGGRVETSVFKVADAALSGQTGEALALLRHMLASGSDPVPVIAGLSVKIRQFAKVLNNSYANAQALGMEQWKIDRVRKELSGWTEEGMATLIQEVATADAAAKGAERDAEFALERLVLTMAAKGQPQ